MAGVGGLLGRVVHAVGGAVVVRGAHATHAPVAGVGRLLGRILHAVTGRGGWEVRGRCEYVFWWR